MSDIPLGRETAYPDTYAPDVLAPIPRADARASLGISDPLPFDGIDIWNAWEMTWLAPGGRPVTATVEIHVPATSANIVESKSLKLYLNSFSMTEYDGPADVESLIRTDLSSVTGAPVKLDLQTGAPQASKIDTLPGHCVDGLDVTCQFDRVDPGTLGTRGGGIIEETLHTHVLRSLCPVTSQPDFGSLLVAYRGKPIDREGLLQYVASFRRHNDFHEACVERMFIDIKQRCDCERLSVYARYNRRGGIDINPWRSDTSTTPENLRLWRQ